MASFGLLGDATTTTALALATSWPGEQDAALFEADPSGGSLAAWLDVPLAPSLSSMVAAVHRSPVGGVEAMDAASVGGADVRSVIDTMTRRAAGGLPFVPCPFTVREAERAVAEASLSIFPTVIGTRGRTTLFDLGRVMPTALPSTIASHDIAIVVHRQERVSASAEAVRLERCVELVTAVRRARAARFEHEVILAVVGDEPFDPDELATHCAVPRSAVITLADDPLTASVLAGGGSMPARRLRRQPLLADARRAASLLATLVLDPIAVRNDGDADARRLERRAASVGLDPEVDGVVT